ncbi:hypothetical protein [Paenibacillus sp. GXUN7292]|uniref:hypothetical protein n=1 Tax=Paenibacillus sp. GXUN7292 TaxID=3422499 RepID=UPI003D7ED775
MKRWKKIVIWVASIIVLLGIGGLFAANYAADRLIASLAASLEAELILDDLNDNSGSSTPEVSGTHEPSSPASSTETNQTPTGEKSSEGSQKSDNNTPNTDYKAEVSVEKAKEVQENITLGEKAKLTSVFLKQLSIEDMKELQKLASGGLSVEEKKKARSLILEKLTPEQYDELIEIAKKYGMSQGKSYEEVNKEK